MRTCVASSLLVPALGLGLGLAAVSSHAAVYQEVNGQVVVEAVHFDYRNYEFTDAAIPHHFHIVPDEDNVTTAAHPWLDTGNNPNDPAGLNQIASSRTGHYVQIVPDSGQNKGNCATCPNENVGFPPYVEYKVNITTLGLYQLYLRQVGWDGGSDSFFGQILEFAPPGPGPNFYRYSPNPYGDFATLQNDPNDTSTAGQGWSGYAASAPRVDGDGGEVKALYNITTAGLYTIRLSQREDGSAVDGIILQLASLAPPTNPGPPESAISTINPPYVRAVDPTPGQQQVPPDNPIGCQIVNGPTKNVATNSIRLIVDNAPVSPSITQTGSVTYVSYPPNPLLTSGKSITWSVIFSDNGSPSTTYTNTFPFSVLPYAPIPTNFIVAPGTVDTTKPGFKIRTAGTAGFGSLPQNSIARAEAALAGTLIDPTTGSPYTNDATPGPNPDGSYDEPGVINYDKLGDTSANGNFNMPNFPDALFPGLPGNGSDDNTALEAITWLNLQPGVYRMVVNSDDNFRVTTGPDPHDKAGLVLGEFDDPAGRGASDSLFIFVVQSAGYYPFRLVWENGGGDSNLEWFTQNVFGRQALINNVTNTQAVKAYRSGPSLPYISRIATSPLGFSLDYKDNGGVVINKNSVQVKLDGSSVPASVGKTNDVTTIAYSSGALFVSGSTHTIGLTFADSGTPPTTTTRSVDFTVETYATIPPSYAVGAPDTTKPGFTLHVNRIDDVDVNGAEVILQPNTIAFTEQQLAGTVTNAATGQPWPNAAIKNPADNSFTYIEPAVINYSRDVVAGTTGPFGNFTPDVQMPGISGTTDLETGNAAMEILTYVDLKAGFQRMGVNSDDGFRLSPATSVNDSRNALTVGVFDGGRGAADTLFDFNVQQAGIYPMRLIWENGGGDCNVEWFSVDIASGTKYLVNDTSKAAAVKAYRAAAGAAQKPVFNAPTITAGTVTITWTGTGTLQQAGTLTGQAIDWSDVSPQPAGNSFTVTPGTAAGGKYYRIKQ